MKTVILGAGALGSILGGYLAEAGSEVTLVARRPHVEAIRAAGLTIEGLSGRRVVRGLQATDDPSEVPSADLLILAVKSFHTDEALRSVLHLRGRVGMAISVQNGWGKDGELTATFGGDAVVGAATLVGGSMPEPGRVVHTNRGGTWVGEFDGRRTARVEALQDLWRRAGLPIEIRSDIQSTIWCKLNQMVPAAALSCVTRLCIHEIYLDRELAGLFVEISREVAQIAQRLNIPLVDLPGLPVKTLCTLPLEEAVDSVQARGRAMREQGMTGVRISMLQDLERGKRTEADQVLGHVVRLADEHGVALPVVRLLYRIIRGIEAMSCARPECDGR